MDPMGDSHKESKMSMLNHKSDISPKNENNKPDLFKSRNSKYQTSNNDQNQKLNSNIEEGT